MRSYMERNLIASSTILNSKPELLGNFINVLLRKMVKIENLISKIYHHFRIFENVFLIILVYSLRWYYLLLNFSPCLFCKFVQRFGDFSPAPFMYKYIQRTFLYFRYTLFDRICYKANRIAHGTLFSHRKISSPYWFSVELHRLIRLIRLNPFIERKQETYRRFSGCVIHY